MRIGDRLEFRNLRCIALMVREVKLKDGTEITRWHYRFMGTDGRYYEYRGKHLFKMEQGCYWDCRATVAWIGRNTVSLKRPVTLEPIATLRLV